MTQIRGILTRRSWPYSMRTFTKAWWRVAIDDTIGARKLAQMALALKPKQRTSKSRLQLSTRRRPMPSGRFPLLPDKARVSAGSLMLLPPRSVLVLAPRRSPCSTQADVLRVFSEGFTG